MDMCGIVKVQGSSSRASSYLLSHYPLGLLWLAVNFNDVLTNRVAIDSTCCAAMLILMQYKTIVLVVFLHILHSWTFIN